VKEGMLGVGVGNNIGDGTENVQNVRNATERKE
jgi:hypothetical protein